MTTGTLFLVLGDQLDLDAPARAGLDPDLDAVWMAEVDEETTHVWCHKLRIAGFLAAMRHHRDALEAAGWTVHYTELTEGAEDDEALTFSERLALDVTRIKPRELRMLHPGDHRVRSALQSSANALGVPLTLLPDPHFDLDLDDFETWMQDRKVVVLEHFYRWMRKRHGILVEDNKPVTGQWNYDADNRGSFGRKGPGLVPDVEPFEADTVSREVIALVERRYASHPGSLAHFDLPVTRADALRALDDFITHRLSRFGETQDAMWEGASFLFHSRLSFPLNLHLLTPAECIERAVEAYVEGRAPIPAVEGFVRQILGWRELVRGLYWHHMPDYAGLNALACDPERDVPRFFWDGETDMACVRDAMRNVIEHGYAHHIQRLMVLGLFAQLAGVHPLRFHEWHMAMYIDAIDWVSLPNALGMSQYGDGGVLGTKPYCATGKYIQRMSNHCKGCRYDPAKATGDDACPFTTLYWDFLARHRETLSGNRRMTLQLKNVDRRKDLSAIRSQAATLLDAVANEAGI
ncbi:MAG: cryptochrome/photolyase family protein [Sandaracinaceae bacterium]